MPQYAELARFVGYRSSTGRFAVSSSSNRGLARKKMLLMELIKIVDCADLKGKMPAGDRQHSTSLLKDAIVALLNLAKRNGPTRAREPSKDPAPLTSTPGRCSESTR